MKRSNRTSRRPRRKNRRKKSPTYVTAIMAALLFAILIAIGHYLLPSPSSSRMSDVQNQLFHSSSGSLVKNDKYRIAIIIPFLSSPHKERHQTTTSILPPYMSIFLRTAHGSASLVDFIIPHNGELTPLIRNSSEDDTSTSMSTIDGMMIPSNVIFLDLKSMEGMTQLFLRAIQTKKTKRNHHENNKKHENEGQEQEERIDDDQAVVEHRDLAMDEETLLKLMTKRFQAFPYSLVEFKPALGYIFQYYLPKDIYSHWGYSDLDIAFGDLPRWITTDELENYDIVTYGYGDTNRAYLRGQFTFHKNSEKLIDDGVWRECKYLSELDKRLAHAMNHARGNGGGGGKKNKMRIRLESAEGCYSHAVLNSNDLKVKYAVKAFTDHLEKDSVAGEETAYSHGVMIGIGNRGDRSVIYKAGQDSRAGQELLKVPLTWFEENDNNQRVDDKNRPSNNFDVVAAKYRNLTQPLQWEVGEMERIQSLGELNPSDTNINCMYWAPREYQRDICLDNVDKTDTVFLINGELYKRKYAQVEFPGKVESMPFFHFQEWKRIYRSSQLTSMHLGGHAIGDLLGWMMVQEGAIPLLAQSSSSSEMDQLYEQVSEQLLAWVGMKELQKKNLPHDTFCLLASKNALFDSTTTCEKTISWHDKQVTIFKTDSSGGMWDDVDTKREITLSLTLQITSEQAQDEESLKVILDLLDSNLLSWKDHPVILVIYISGSEQWIQDEIEKRFNEVWSYYSLQLTGVIFAKENTIVSRNALINMAESASPTRWIISGLEVERGLIFSEEAYFFAKRAATIYGKVAGNIFVIPQFALVDGDETSSSSPMSILELMPLEDSGDESKLSSNLKSFDCIECEEEIEDKHENIDNQIDQVWWDLTKSEIAQDENADGESLLQGIMDKDSTEILANVIDGFQMELTDMLANIDKIRQFDKFPILLLDMLGPRNGMVTSNLAAEVDEFGGLLCMNAYRLAQLSTYGYRIFPLYGAFAISTPDSRSAFCAFNEDNEAEENVHEQNVRGTSRCYECPMMGDVSLTAEIVRQETVRIAKTTLLWNEMS